MFSTPSFKELKRNLKKDFSRLKKYRIALLGDTATQLYSQALKGYGYELGIDVALFESEYDQIERQVFDLSSEFYKFKAQYVIVFYSTQKLLKSFYKLDNSEKSQFADNHIHSLKNLVSAIQANGTCKIIYFNFPEINDSVFGNFSNKLDVSFVFQLRKINYELMQFAVKTTNLYINDLCGMQGQYGFNFVSDPKVYINTDIVFSIDFLPLIAKNTLDILQAIEGKFKKCLILDLDNTMWGGIIGDDGIENIQIGNLGIGKAFTELQYWAKQLQERGIILAICSKNTEHIAKEPFEKHPDMALKLDDISVFVANWENKVDNIKYIQSILNIGFDAMVFLDDNPFERNIVRSHIPYITVPELPEDPAEYLPYLRTLNLFETASFTEEDTLRTKQYQEEAKREMQKVSFTSEDDFLENLGMKSDVRSFDKFNTPRVAQLSQRSNQFNLRTIRYTEDDIYKINISENHITLSFTLEDKFGDYGLISMLILKKQTKAIFVDTWIMSCRVLKRGMENFVLNQIVAIARQNNLNEIIGEYIATNKNGIVKDHYENLGFKAEGNLWKLDLEKYKPLKTFISKINL